MGDLGFWRLAESDPDWLALVDPDGGEHTAGELLGRANQAAHALRSLGLGVVDTLAVLLPNGTPLIELYVVYNELRKYLDGRGVTIARNLIGSYITSLEMAGCSITLLKLNDDLVKLWDAPVKTAGLRWGV